jgi:hypothetical protein
VARCGVGACPLLGHSVQPNEEKANRFHNIRRGSPGPPDADHAAEIAEVLRDGRINPHAIPAQQIGVARDRADQRALLA